jgi:hypothetical protein
MPGMLMPPKSAHGAVKTGPPDRCGRALLSRYSGGYYHAAAVANA